MKIIFLQQELTDSDLFIYFKLENRTYLLTLSLNKQLEICWAEIASCLMIKEPPAFEIEYDNYIISKKVLEEFIEKKSTREIIKKMEEDTESRLLKNKDFLEQSNLI